ncbi:alpha/beta hydrolase family protein [Cohnella kolymensis]|uniref:alpha/beta hydrolase family protein n=1 Tax=Cohnella kolymensis TaxID=1590652 RepID=UPI0009E652DC|nr:alpha/beta fold hydrolase [Cohnella kolymensis]
MVPVQATVTRRSALTSLSAISLGACAAGVAVLRYDKRTFAHGRSFTPEMLAKFTVKEETVEDAIAASKLLKNDKRIDSARVFIVGHSLGGMLAPRIDAEGGSFAGLIIMAGTAREFWQISYDQNEAFIKAMDDNDPTKKTNEAWLAAELVKAQNIKNMSDEEAMAAVIFGVPAYYLKDMESHSTADLTVKLRKPVLIMQGEDDFQVFKDKDYTLWQDLLKENSNAAFKLYPGLNHAFVHYEGDGKGTVEEYKHPGNVEPQVIRDIADWILKN